MKDPMCVTARVMRVARRSVSLAAFLAAGFVLASASVVAAPLGKASDCEQDEVRQQQAYEFSAQVGRELLSESESTPVPWRVQYLFQQLLPHVQMGESEPTRLQGYVSDGLTAQAAGPHLLLVSSVAWVSTPAWTDDEVAALLAHELAHLERRDMVRWGCFSWKLEGRPRQTLADALRATLATLDDGSPKSRAASAFLHETELTADRRARELLSAAGFATEGLDSLLKRVARQDSSPHLTHPAAAERLEHLR